MENVLSLNSIYKLRRWWPGWLVVPSVSLFFHLLHMLPLGTTFVPLPPLLPVPHLFTVLIQAKAGAADQLDVVLVPQPGLRQQIPHPALLVLSLLGALHLSILDDVQIQLHDGVHEGVLLGFAEIGSRIPPL